MQEIGVCYKPCKGRRTHSFKLGLFCTCCFIMGMLFNNSTKILWLDIYSRPTVSMGSTPVDQKYLKKNSRKFQKAKLEFAACIYIVLGITI